MTTSVKPNPPTFSPYYEYNKYSGQLHDWSISKITISLWAPVGILGLAASVVTRVVEALFMLTANTYLALKYMCLGSTIEPIAHIAAPRRTIAEPPTPRVPLITTPRIVNEPVRNLQTLPLPIITPRLASSLPTSLPTSLPMTFPQTIQQNPPPLSARNQTGNENSPPRVLPAISPQILQRTSVRNSSPIFPTGILQAPARMYRSNPAVHIDQPIPEARYIQPSTPSNFPPAILPSSQLNTNRAFSIVAKDYGVRFQRNANNAINLLREHKKTSIAAAGLTGLAAAGVISLAPPLLPVLAGVAAARFAWNRLHPARRNLYDELPV